jgi:XTP/dITP diphosphohydrolase
MQNLLLASSNAGKLKELQQLTAGLPVTWLSLADVGLAGMDVEETGVTFVENALLKARAYGEASSLPTLADDSGLMVDALDGAPGVYSARYAPTTEARNAKLLKAVEAVPDAQRTARFVSALAFVMPTGVTVIAEGTVEGKVGTAPRGENGFGYDPIFVLENGKTMAELPASEKNQISHRARAYAKLLPLLRCLFG